MTELVRCATAHAPSMDVWRVLQDVRHLADWSPSTTAVDGPAQLTAVGDTFVQTVVVAGRPFTSRWRVVRFDAGRRICLSGRLLPGVRVEMDETITAVDGGTEICLTMRYKLPFGPVGRLAARLGLEARAGREAGDVLAAVVAEAERASAPR
jgi:hypothetical protein